MTDDDNTATWLVNKRTGMAHRIKADQHSTLCGVWPTPETKHRYGVLGVEGEVPAEYRCGKCLMTVVSKESR